MFEEVAWYPDVTDIYLRRLTNSSLEVNLVIAYPTPFLGGWKLSKQVAIQNCIARNGHMVQKHLAGGQTTQWHLEKKLQ